MERSCRILVLGDASKISRSCISSFFSFLVLSFLFMLSSDVGKSALISLLTQQTILPSSSSSTLPNPNIQVLEHSSTSSWLEFLEVPSHSRHPESRSCLYQSSSATPISGLLLVYDLSNRKSAGNLWKWLSETTTASNNSYQSSLLSIGSGNSSTIPVLIVGNKVDLLNERAKVSYCDDLNADAIHLSALDLGSLSDSSIMNSLNTFYSAVLKR